MSNQSAVQSRHHVPRDKVVTSSCVVYRQGLAVRSAKLALVGAVISERNRAALSHDRRVDVQHLNTLIRHYRASVCVERNYLVVRAS